jgi:hypothetical protein
MPLSARLINAANQDVGLEKAFVGKLDEDGRRRIELLNFFFLGFFLDTVNGIRAWNGPDQTIWRVDFRRAFSGDRGDGAATESECWG